MTALLPLGVKVHLALGFIDMRKGIDGPAMLVQSVLQQDTGVRSARMTSARLSRKPRSRAPRATRQSALVVNGLDGAFTRLMECCAC